MKEVPYFSKSLPSEDYPRELQRGMDMAVTQMSNVQSNPIFARDRADSAGVSWNLRRDFPCHLGFIIELSIHYFMSGSC